MLAGVLALGSLWLGRMAETVGPRPTGRSVDNGVVRTGYSGKLYTLDLSKINPALLPDLPDTLQKSGVVWGQALDRQTVLLRVPQSKLNRVKQVCGEAVAPYAASRRINPRLSNWLSRPQGVSRTVDITLFHPGDKERAVREITSLGGQLLRGADEQGLVLRASLPDKSLKELAQLDEVVYVEPAAAVRLLNDRAADLVGAAPLQVPGFLTCDDGHPGIGLNGAGQMIGLADSGLDTGKMEDLHPDLTSSQGNMPKVVMLKSWAGAAYCRDLVGHGTHMAGTIAGTGSASQGRYKGIAPGASLYFQGIMNAKGELEPPPDPTTLFEPAYQAGVRVHVDGWGGDGSGYLAVASQTDRFVRQHPDFLPVFAAGNSGPKAGSLTREAASKNALVVGASQSPHPLFDSHQEDASQPAGFSSTGPTGDGRLKPDLLAPGAAVSTRSRLAGESMAVGKDYTYLEGTSVAAAVAGGSAALLRQYYQKYENLDRPSAALLKASLIAGARTGEKGPDGNGFGILDLAETVLSLREKTFRYLDSAQIGNGGEERYTFQVEGGESPVKVVLVWTDPEAAPGATRALINDLDLVVKDPSGREWLGNSFLNQSQPDRVNNVEEVYIPHPVAGQYTVLIRGTSISRGVVSGAGLVQDFSLVYGQPLDKETVASGDGRQLTLASGGVVSLTPELTRLEENGSLLLSNSGQGLSESGLGMTGADIYLSPDHRREATAYLVRRLWVHEGVQVVKTGSGYICAEVNQEERSGGYDLAPLALLTLQVNGKAVQDPDVLPVGSRITALINPSSQTIWKADFSYREIEGFLDRIDLSGRNLYLLGRDTPYHLSSSASLSYYDDLSQVDPADLPYGGSSPPDWSRLLPGLKVKLMINQDSGQVMYVGAQRDLVAGSLVRVDPVHREVYLSNGRSYRVSEGISLLLDGREAGFDRLQPGQHLEALLLPGTSDLLAIKADSRVIYGRVVYNSPGQHLLYLTDDRNNFRVLSYSGETLFYRWGLPADPAMVESGQWCRLVLSPGSPDSISSGCFVETGAEQSVVLRGYQPDTGVLTTDNGSFQLSGRTLILKNGLPVQAEDLVPGESLTVTAYLNDTDNGPLLAEVSARVKPGADPPRLEVAAPWRGSQIIISGVTSGDRLYLYVDGERSEVAVGQGGRFTCNLQGVGQEEELHLQLVAVDTTTGAVAGQRLSVPPRTDSSFSDLQGHWSAADVEALLAQHLLSGYPDGTFRPNSRITRAELVVLLANALGWSDSATATGFSDDQAIPGWARPAVVRARKEHLLTGYPDGSFGPERSVTRAEAAVWFDKALAIYRPGSYSSPPNLSWLDSGQIPSWAREAAGRLLQAGVMRGRSEQLYDPEARLTRGEAAALINRLLEQVRL